MTRDAAGAAASIRPGPGGAGSLLDVKVVPGASRAEIAGRHGDGLRVRVAAPPERGRANEELCRVLAEALGVPQRDVVVLRGAASARKSVHVRSLAPAELSARLRGTRPDRGAHASARAARSPTR